VFKGILNTPSWGWWGASSTGVGGNLGMDLGRGCFQPFGEAPRAVLRLIQAHRFLPPPTPHLCLRLKVSVPGVVGVPMKVIVVQGELREMIQDVSGLP